MKNIVLIGMMGCGKTTCANLLTQKLGREAVDTDDIIVEREGRSISDIFSSQGEGYFRSVESAVAKELGKHSGLIIATGGGLPMKSENVAALRENGILFWLKRDPTETFARESMAGRPLAQDGQKAFLERFAARSPVYEAAADYVIEDFTSPENTVAEIMKRI